MQSFGKRRREREPDLPALRIRVQQLHYPAPRVIDNRVARCIDCPEMVADNLPILAGMACLAYPSDFYDVQRLYLTN